jgi:hypothetical protein
MKNVTITMDEAVLRWARIKAAEQDTSVSRLVGDMLRLEMNRDDDVERAVADYFADDPGHPISDGTPYPKREELYDRPVLRRHERADLRQGQSGFAEEAARSELDKGAVAPSKRRRKPASSK